VMTGCPTATALAAALQGRDFASVLTAMPRQYGDMTMPYSNLSEATVFLKGSCMTLMVGAEAKCMPKAMIGMG
jgi:hypothetical protein